MTNILFQVHQENHLRLWTCAWVCVHCVYTRKIDRWWWGVWSHENGRDGFRSEKITNPKISSSSSSSLSPLSLHLPVMKINMRSFWTLLCVTICLGVGFVYTMLGSAQLSSAHKLEFIVDKSIINYCLVRVYGMGVCVCGCFSLCVFTCKMILFIC